MKHPSVSVLSCNPVSDPRVRRHAAVAALTLLAAGGLPGTLHAAPAAGATTPVRKANLLSVSFSNIDVRQVLATLADYAKVDVLVTPGARGKVSVNLRQRTADELIRYTAASAGLVVVRTGEAYIVGPAAEVRQAASRLGHPVLVPLRFADPQETRGVLAQVAPSVSVEISGSTLILSGTKEDVETARAAIQQLDVAVVEKPQPPAKPETGVFSLHFANPEDVQRVLKEAFPNVQITRKDATFIAQGTPEDLQAADRAVKALDIEPPKTPDAPEKRETRVYTLAYLNAKTAEEALKKAIPGLIVASGPEPTSPPPALFEPLSLSLGFMSSGTSGSGSGGLGGGLGGGGFGGSGAGGLGGGSGAGGQSTNYRQQLDRATRLILIGTTRDLEVAQQILKETDVAPPRVSIEAELVEIQHDDTNNTGIQWDLSNLGSTFTFPGGTGIRFGTVKTGASQFTANIQALILQNRARVLARPNISVLDNEDANIFIGDLVRFRGINVVTPNVGTVQGTETIPVGIALLVRPRIHPDGRVTMKVHPVISTVSATVDGLPQTSSREADTTVRLDTGEALVIGGLQREEEKYGLRKVPGLGDLPLLGSLFRSRTREKHNTEIVVVLRTQPVRDNDKGTVPLR